MSENDGTKDKAGSGVCGTRGGERGGGDRDFIDIDSINDAELIHFS